jgi:magnesium transporter
VPLSSIMNGDVILVNDYDPIDSVAELLSKYNLIALPVVDRERKMVGMIIIDDVIELLLKRRRKTLSLSQP